MLPVFHSHCCRSAAFRRRQLLAESHTRFVAVAPPAHLLRVLVRSSTEVRSALFIKRIFCLQQTVECNQWSSGVCKRYCSLLCLTRSSLMLHFSKHLGTSADCMYRAPSMSDHGSLLTQAGSSPSPRISAIHALDRATIGFDEQQRQALVNVSCAIKSATSENVQQTT